MPHAPAMQIKSTPTERCAVIPFPSATARTSAQRPIEPAVERERIEMLRDCLSTARLAGRDDIDRICARIVCTAPTTAQRYGVALFQALPDAARQRLVFHGAGSPSLSDDETWLLRLIRSVEAGDQANIAALLGFRIKPSHQRRIRFLVAGFAKSLLELRIVEEDVASGAWGL